MTISTKIEAPEGHSVHHVVCPHDCPDTCSMLVTRDDSTGKAVRIQGDPTHPVTQGYLCNKVNHYLDLVYNDNRVLYPQKRIGNKGPGAKFERISWDEALETVTNNFKSVIAEYGSEAVQPYSYSGTMGMLGFWAMDSRFWNKMNAARLEQSICIYAAMWAGLHTYGVANGPAINEAAEEAEIIILWGANLVSTGVHAVPALREAKQRGCKLIVIDPRKTRTTMMADWHIQPRPGTDGALALGMMKVIVDRGLHDIEFLKEQTNGWEALLEHKLPDYPLDEVERITGIPAADVEKFALLYAATKKSFIRANYGLNRHQNAGQMCRAVLILPCITGAWREPCGGAAFGTLEEMFLRFDLPKLQRPDLGNRDKMRIVNMAQIGRALVDNIGVDEKPLDPPIKSLFVYNSDPANCAPNSNNVRKGLARDDLFVAVHDTFWTDTCLYADIVLPADTQLERMDLHAAYGHWYFNMNKPVIEPLAESVRNTELFRKLAKAMGYVEDGDNAFTQTDEEMIRDILFDAEVNPLMEGITYEQLEKNGWARACTESSRRAFLEIGWPTPSGKIDIWCEALQKEGQDPLPTYNPEKEGQEDPLRKKYPIQVLSSASHYFIGDSFQSVPRLQAMMSRPTVELSPQDADVRGIADGDFCRIYNDRGETYAHAVIVDGLLPGVCSTQKQFKGSNTHNGVNINALNSEQLTDFGMSPSFYSVLVEIEKAATDGVTPSADPEIKQSRVKLVKGSIAGIESLTHDTYKVVIRCDDGMPALSGSAGQYAAITFPGVDKPRCYSFAESPEDENPGEHTFFVRQVPRGEVSKWITGGERIGERVELAGPLGNFKLDSSTDPMVCIAGGSGMSAIKAIVERAAALSVARDCYFFYGARTQNDLYCLDEMKALKNKWNKGHQFTFVPVLSEEPKSSGWKGARGLVTDYFKQEILDQNTLEANTLKAYFCGPPVMIDHGISLLKNAGTPADNIFYDKFEDSNAPAPVVDNSKCVLCDECLLVKPVADCLVEASQFMTDGAGTVTGYERIRPSHTSGLYYNALFIDEKECIRCFACVEACPHEAISVDYSKVSQTLRQWGLEEN